MQRPSERAHDALRPITFTRGFTQHAEGSVLATFGNTQVICNASIEERVPRFLKDSQQGWVTAEYGMLPRSTHQRMQREASTGKQSGRTIEIQRLIGRTLRTITDLKAIKGHTIAIDCDVIQADGGTRTTAISGACVALYDALTHFQQRHQLAQHPMRHFVAAVSVGIYHNQAILDLDYAEDAQAQTDMNLIMTDQDEWIEIQGTAEQQPLSQAQLMALLDLGKQGIQSIIQQQKISLGVLNAVR